MNFNSISDDIEQSKLYSKQSKTILKFRISKHVSNANLLSTSAHVRLDYACEVLYVILTLNYMKLINICIQHKHCIAHQDFLCRILNVHFKR